MPSMISNDASQKNLAQQNRQRCIALLEKIAKSCYSMFRNEAIPKEIIKKKFGILKKKLDQLGNIYLDTEYHAETRKYIEKLSKILQSEQDFE
jgi:1,2-phenylacetyl-CoA epoxidase catalytic subunit